MKNKIEHSFAFKPSWLTSLSLVIILYLMYSPTFLVDYLMNDEWANIGLRPAKLVSVATGYFFVYGRGLFGVYQQLVYRFVDYDPDRVQLVRFLNFTSIAAIAVILLRFVEIRSKNSYFAFFVILLFLSQPSFQGMVGYSLQLISNSQPAMWLSLLAFYLYFFVFDNERFSKPVQAVVVFLILILAMQSTQTYAFFAMVPLAYLVLTDWEKRKIKAWSFLLISIGVFLLSSLAYKVGLEFWHTLGKQGYTSGERSLETVANEPLAVLLRAINPLAYWSAFKVWSYPFPLQNTLPLGESKQIIASFIMVVWIVLILGAIITEFRRGPTGEKRQILHKWLAVLVCLGFGAVLLVADSPQKIIEHRPHVTLTLVGVVILSGAYGLQVLTSRYPFFKNELMKSLGVFLVLMIAFGAQAGVLRSMVNNRMEQINFIRTELMTKSPSDYKNIIVVLPNWYGCITEPCDQWMGITPSIEWHLTREGVYRYALTTINVPPKGKNITFVNQKPAITPRDAVIIDWNKYVSAWKGYSEYLRQKN